MSALNTLSRYGGEKFRQEAEEGFNAEVNNASSEADKLELLISIRSFSFLFIKSAPRRLPPAKSEAVQKGLRALWYMFIQTAKVLDKDSPVHDKLVLLLLFTKELDLVHRNLHPTEVAATTWESYGFFDSLQASWQHALTVGTVSQQRNLAAFSSKALATGIWSESLALVTLWYLREALETEDETKTIALLPATVVWFENANLFLLNFSLANKPSQRQSNGYFLSAGALAHKSGIESCGFSMNRWLFWRKRLRELSHHTDPAVAKEAKRGFMVVISSGRELEYDIPGEAKFHELFQKTMWEALVKSGKESLDGDEIDIDVDWVNGEL